MFLLYDVTLIILSVLSLREIPDKSHVKEEGKVEALLVSVEVAEMEPSNTQENGPLQKEVKQTATPSPRTGSELKENSARAQDEAMKDRNADSGPAELLQCTLNSLQNEHATADWEVLTNAAPQEENPASMKDTIPDRSSLTAVAVFPENPTETNTTREVVTVDTTHDNDEDARAKVAAAGPSGEFSQNDEVLSVPNTQHTAAACQLSPISAVSQEINNQPPSW